MLVLMTKQPLGNVVERGHSLVQKYAQMQPGLATDAEVLDLLKKTCRRAAPRRVSSTRRRDVVARPVPAPGSHVSALSGGTAAPGQDRRRSAEQPPDLWPWRRGVLYALDPLQGKVRWLMRGLGRIRRRCRCGCRQVRFHLADIIARWLPTGKPLARD